MTLEEFLRYNTQLKEACWKALPHYREMLQSLNLNNYYMDYYDLEFEESSRTAIFSGSDRWGDPGELVMDLSIVTPLETLHNPAYPFNPKAMTQERERLIKKEEERIAEVQRVKQLKEEHERNLTIEREKQRLKELIKKYGVPNE